MKISAVATFFTNLENTVSFYKILGFEFGDYKPDEQHLEPTTPVGSPRLMLDSEALMADILGEKPKAANHSCFAIEFDSPKEVNIITKQIEEAGYKVLKQPWDAFWGQRYAIVSDPDGHLIDLFAQLSS